MWGIREDRPYIIAIITLYVVINLWLHIMLNTPPAGGYEISIYNVYSPLFWFLFILTIVLGIGLTILFMVRGVNLWRYSLTAILIVDTVVLFLPMIRGYEFYALAGSDIFAHLAWSEFITNTGHIMGGDHYPATHILMTVLKQLSLFNPAILAIVVPFLFFILYILSLFLLGRTIYSDNMAGALFSLVGSPLLFTLGHYDFYPFVFALLLFPLIFYSMHKIEVPSNREMYYICFVILSLFIVFCHPLTSIILILTLGVLYGYSQISNKYRLRFPCRPNILNMIAIVGITFVFWYTHFWGILKMGENVISALLGGSDKATILTSNLELVEQSGLPVLRIAEVFIKNYGSMIIYFIVALLIVIYLAKGFLIRRKYADEMAYVTFFLLSIAFGAALVLGHFIVRELIRAACFSVIMATIVCCIGVYIFFKYAGASTRKETIALVTIAMLCLVSSLSVFSVYDSPWTTSVSMHMTKMETSGLDWFLMKQDESMPVYILGSSWRTYPTYFQELHNVPVQKPRAIVNGLPTHFGYDQNNYISQSISDSGKVKSYLATNELIRQSDLAFPEEVQAARKHFLQEDFSRLNCDTTVNKLYMNYEWELWMIGSVI